MCFYEYLIGSPFIAARVPQLARDGIRPVGHVSDVALYFVPSTLKVVRITGECDLFESPVLGAVRVISHCGAMHAAQSVETALEAIWTERKDVSMLHPAVRLRTGFTLSRAVGKDAASGLDQIWICLCDARDSTDVALVEFQLTRPDRWMDSRIWQAHLHVLLRCARLTESLNSDACHLFLNNHVARYGFAQPPFLYWDDSRTGARQSRIPVREAQIVESSAAPVATAF